MHLLPNNLQLFAGSRVAYISVVSKILDYSLDASRDERIDDDYLYRDGREDVEEYSSDYVKKRKEEEMVMFIENAMDFENGNIHFATGSDLYLSIEIEETHSEVASAVPSSKRR